METALWVTAELGAAVADSVVVVALMILAVVVASLSVLVGRWHRAWRSVSRALAILILLASAAPLVAAWLEG
jgi:uncharacterized membrane protein YhaH (DUF805 family)